MLSSSVSVLVFEKQELQESPPSPLGGVIREGPLSALS